MVDYENEDVGNIFSLEHVNLQVPDQNIATLFYVVGLGLTRDPYLNVGLQNMWVNVGEQQFHLPTRPAQVIDGCIGLVLPQLDALRERLMTLEEPLRATKFSWSAAEEQIEVMGPWGNRFRCHAAGESFGDMALGLAYVEFRVAQGSAVPIAGFYQKVLDVPVIVTSIPDGSLAVVRVGRNQSLRFREVNGSISLYDGHHIAIYVARFSRVYTFLKNRNLVFEDVSNHQFRFKEIIDPETNSVVFQLEHEVRSLYHPMFYRPFTNRDPRQSQRMYRRGRDGLVPYRR